MGDFGVWDLFNILSTLASLYFMLYFRKVCTRGWNHGDSLLAEMSIIGETLLGYKVFSHHLTLK